MALLLPAGIESYLKEIGFSATEMLVLRRLLEEESITIRELGAKTGKSTGVLDQAMKKLLQKKIAVRGMINDQPRYSIPSLESIVRWVKSDMESRKNMLERRHKDFESFIASLTVDKKHPEMEHYSGWQGIQDAYVKLLASGQELLTFTPVPCNIEDDPLRAFRVEFFRKRQVRKIFQRILAPDTPLARRFQSRDPFEYRRTLLVPETELPLSFEKTIVGDTVACINFRDQTASFLQYPELAKSERAAFEALWNKQLHAAFSDESPSRNEVGVPLKTSVFSACREFLLSGKSIAMLVVFALIAATLTFGLYKTNRENSVRGIQDKVSAIATTGALQINPIDLDALRVQSDYLKPEWKKVVSQLKEIHRRNSDIMYVYIVRKSASGGMEFVSDSNSLDPWANTDADPTNDIDTNRDGTIDGSPTGGDYLQWPGQPYLTPPAEVLEAFEHPVVMDDFYVDQWGDVISAYAPITDASGNTVAVLGVDMKASDVESLIGATFSPLYVFVALLLCYLFVRLCEMGYVVSKK